MVALSIATPAGCLYTRHYSGIHRFVFSDSSTAAIDTWIHHLETLYREDADDTLLMLVDARRAGVQPLSYITERSREINACYPERPATRTAFLYDTHFAASLARNCIVMLSRIGMDTVRFFPGDQHESDAVVWLLAGE